APGGRVALLSSVNRGLLPAPLTNAFAQPLTGIRVFGRDEITDSLREHGMEKVAQRVSGLAQFVSAPKPLAQSSAPRPPTSARSTGFEVSSIARVYAWAAVSASPERRSSSAWAAWSGW